MYQSNKTPCFLTNQQSAQTVIRLVSVCHRNNVLRVCAVGWLLWGGAVCLWRDTATQREYCGAYKQVGSAKRRQQQKKGTNGNRFANDISDGLCI